MESFHPPCLETFTLPCFSVPFFRRRNEASVVYTTAPFSWTEQVASPAHMIKWCSSPSASTSPLETLSRYCIRGHPIPAGSGEGRILNPSNLIVTPCP